MIDIETWTKEFTQKVELTFGDRVWFIGLQGSYAGGEATDTSDIDAVVILDELSINDLKAYGDMLDALPNRGSICGFVSGKTELLNWEASDLFQFCYGTIPIKGTLDPLFDRIDRDAVNRAIRIGACNIYHACVHNFLHEKSDEILRSLYKSAVFVLQAIAFLRSGKFIKCRADLQNAIEPAPAVLAVSSELKNGASVEFEKMSELLLCWSQTVISGYAE